jgi:hypothetical protein
MLTYAKLVESMLGGTLTYADVCKAYADVCKARREHARWYVVNRVNIFKALFEGSIFKVVSTTHFTARFTCFRGTACIWMYSYPWIPVHAV